jgi:ABC-type branched-subunit amino acid transport system substrate-binding protein
LVIRKGKSMTELYRRRTAAAIPIALGVALLVTACGSGGGEQVATAPAPPAAAPAADANSDASTATLIKAVIAYLDSQAKPNHDPTLDKISRQAVHKTLDEAEKIRSTTGAQTAKAPAAPAAAIGAKNVNANATVHDDAVAAATDTTHYQQTQGATDVGIGKDTIKLGSINMHGMALGNIVTAPMVRGNEAAVTAINDRGGVLGRRISITDCDDGPGEVSRAKACIKKLVSEDHVFSLISAVDWATASLHDDLKQYHLPYVGAWAYSQTEWQDPFMFPTHMSMIHEAMAGAHWVVNVIKTKSYGLICLTSPEMQLACNQVEKVVDASGAKMVKRADVAISETSMSAYVLAMRAAAPEHIVHYVINPATMVKFMVESQQQGYYPPKGISGNHLAAELLGSLFGKWPAGRYWTNTTYKLWGPEFISTMHKYAPANDGENHHIVQAGYVGVNVFAQAAKEVGPNLTRDRLMAALGNGAVWQTDSALDQRFSYVNSERYGENWDHNMGQGREFIYKYTSDYTVSNPDGTPNGWQPDPDQFVIFTDH